ncbi:MAG: class I SAM-dependent methyltransferase [Caldilineaceae bacterium]
MNALWQAGVAPEIDFWDGFIGSRGSLWPEDFEQRMDPARPLQDHVTEILDFPVGSTIKILDVGAGPLTYLGKIWPGRTLEITAVDPLADEYAAIFQRHQLAPPIVTQRGAAEELVAQFGENSFDLVHARNCIDHSFDAVRAIEQMVAVAKPGGLVYMHHAVNEADTEGYHGFHQWNFHGTTEWFWVSNQAWSTNMTLRLAAVAEVTNQLFGNGEWIITKMKKHTRLPQLVRWRHVATTYHRWLWRYVTEKRIQHSDQLRMRNR